MSANDWGILDGNFNEIKEEQGSPEWLENRKKRLGASEIASVLGISPYKSARELWREKTGLDQPDNIGHLPHVRRGVEAEPVARTIVETIQGIKYTTPVLSMKGSPHFAASLDGLASDHILEIKTMGLENHRAVAKGEVPGYYLTQLQWGMMIADRPRALFVSYRPEDWTLYHCWIQADKGRQSEYLYAAVKFWEMVELNIEPADPFDDFMERLK